jgi:predicted Zn-dependent protease
MEKLLNLLEAHYAPEEINPILQAVAIDPLITAVFEQDDFLSRYWEVNQKNAALWQAANIAAFAGMYYGTDQHENEIGKEAKTIAAIGKLLIEFQDILKRSATIENAINGFKPSVQLDETQLDKIFIYAYGTQENKAVYLIALAKIKGIDLAGKAVLQHEFTETQRLNRFSEFLSDQAPSAVEQLVQVLQQFGFKSTSQAIVRDWLARHEGQMVLLTAAYSPEQLAALAALYQVIGEEESRNQTLGLTEQRLVEVSNNIQYQKFMQKRANDGQPSVKAVNLKKIPESFQATFVLQAREISPADLAELPSIVKENPLAAIRMAGLLLETNPVEAKDMAENAVRTLKQHDMLLELYLPKSIQNWQPAELLDTLNRLQLPAETVHLGKVLLKKRPNDMAIIQEMIKANQELKNWHEAEIQARLRYLNEPEDQNGLRTLAEVYERAERWPKAYDAWKLAFSKDSKPDTALVAHYMQAAVEADHAKEAVKIYESLPEEQSNHDTVLHQYGKAFVKLGDPTNAERAFLQGTRLNTNNGENWLALAELYQSMGQKAKCIETLKTAAVHAPENTQILVSLANLYIDKKDMETARKLMKQAVVKEDLDYKTGLELLSNLERLQENQLFHEYAAKLQQRWPNDGAIAYQMAKSCLGMGKKNDALQAFEVAAHVENPSVQWLLDYASALVDEGTEVFEQAKTIPMANYVKALQLLDDVSDTGTSHSSVYKLLHGELLLEIGRYEEAFALYKKLSDGLDGLGPVDVNRFQTGLGTSAHYLGENETALAALKVAGKDSEHPVFVYQRMAEAYRDLQFPDEALQAAKSALSAGPTTLNNLSWFAEFAISMDATDDAKEALAVATELAPQDIEYWIAYAVILAKLQDWTAFDEAMSKIRQFPRLNEQQRLKIADLYVDINEINRARDFLQEGLLTLEQNEISTTYTLSSALLAYKTGSLSEATTMMQQLIEKRDWDAGLHTLFGDLLAKQEKYRAAKASYDHACKLLEMEEGDQNVFTTLSSQIRNLFTEDWFASLYQIPAITLRWSAIEMNEKKYEDAALRAKQVINNKNAMTDASLLQLGMSAYLLQRPELSNQVKELFSTHMHEKSCQNVILHALAAELALDAHDDVAAGALIFPNLQAEQNDFWTASIQGRLLLQSGEWARAEKIFSDLSNELMGQDQKKNTDTTWINELLLPISEIEIKRIAMLKYAVALRKWKEAAQIRNDLAKVKQGVPVIGLSLIAADLATAEFKRIADEFEISSHTPDEAVIQESGYSRSMELLTGIKPNIEINLYTRLVNRIQLVYRPTLQAIRDMVQLVPDDDDIRYLVPAVRRLDHCQGVTQLAQKAKANADILMNVALCKMSQTPEEAINGFADALKIKPNDPVLYTGMSMAYEKAGKLQQSYDALEEALNIWSDESLWHVRAADLAETLQNSGVSHNHYAKAYQIAPKDMRVTNRYIKNLITDSQYQEAYEILDTAQKNNPEDWNLDLLLAEIYENVGEFDNALVELERAVEKSGGDAQAKLRMARVLLHNHAFTEAYSLVKELPVEKESIEEAVYIQAAALDGMGDEKKALHLLEKYLSTHTVKEDSLMVAYVKIVRKQQGDRTAIGFAEDILTRFPDSSETCALLADMHYECGDVEDAGKYLEKGLVLNSHHAGMNYINGLIAAEKGNLDLAVHSFVTTIQQEPDRVDAFMALSDVHLRRREYDDAAKVMRQGIDANPQELNLLLEAAKIYKDSKDYGEAETMLRKAAALKPDDINIQRQLGAIIALNLVHNQ